MSHIFLREHDQGRLNNPPNVHLKVEKSRRSEVKREITKGDTYQAAEYLWFEQTYPTDLPAQLSWALNI